MIKALFHQKDITILNVYAPNNRASKYMKQGSSQDCGVGIPQVQLLSWQTKITTINRETIDKKDQNLLEKTFYNKRYKEETTTRWVGG